MSGRMNFDEFLNALMAVASRICVEQPPSRDALERAFCEVLTEHLLPWAMRWQCDHWALHGEMARHSDVTGVLSYMRDPLRDLFKVRSTPCFGEDKGKKAMTTGLTHGRYTGPCELTCIAGG